jgi:hypothetical protein
MLGVKWTLAFIGRCRCRALTFTIRHIKRSSGDPLSNGCAVIFFCVVTDEVKKGAWGVRLQQTKGENSTWGKKESVKDFCEHELV